MCGTEKHLVVVTVLLPASANALTLRVSLITLCCISPVLQATTNFANRDEMRSRLTEQERIERNQQLQKTLALLVHACSCHNPQCGSTSCRKVRALFQHAVQCTLKVTGGCHLCKKMWCLLNLHAKSCTTSDCPVPRCRWVGRSRSGVSELCSLGWAVREDAEAKSAAE
jgi:hypothetical protein